MLTYRSPAALVWILTVAALSAACSAPAGSPSGAERSASALLSDAARTAESVVASVGARLGVTLASPVPLSPTAPAAEATPPAAPAPARRPRPAPVTPAPAPAPEPAAAEVEPEPPAPVIEETVADVVSVPVRVEDPILYSPANAEVEPPRPPVPTRLRPWRPDAVTRGPSIDVTVSSDGTVEKVRLVSGTRLADMMLLSHVKAWRFEPATREGEPVRFQLRLEDPVVAP